MVSIDPRYPGGPEGDRGEDARGGPAGATRGQAGSRTPRAAPPARKWTLLGISLLVPVVPFMVLGELPGEQWVERAAAGSVGPIGALVLASDVFLPIPSTIVGSYLGYHLGAWQGSLWAWLGLVVGNVAGWTFGRLSLSWLGTQFEASPSAWLLLATRPLPILAEAAVVATGAAGVPFRRVLLPIVAGNAVFALALAASGARLREPGMNVEWLAVPLGLPLLGLWFGRWWKKRRSAER